MSGLRGFWVFAVIGVLYCYALLAGWFGCGLTANGCLPFLVVVVVSFVVLLVGWGDVTVWLGLVVLGRYVWLLLFGFILVVI